MGAGEVREVSKDVELVRSLSGGSPAFERYAAVSWAR
jgi:hypothetical protein